MNICILTRAVVEHGVKGGMEQHCKIISEGFSERGHNVTIITTKNPKGKEYEKIKNVNIYYIQSAPTGIYSKKWWYSSVRKLEELHHENKFDIIISQSWAARSCINKFRYKYKIPTVTIIHGTAINGIKNRISVIYTTRDLLRFIRYIHQLIFRYIFIDIPTIFYSRAIISVATELKNEIKAHYFCWFKRIHVVNNGINVDLFRPKVDCEFLKKKYKLEKNTKIILTVSRITKDKGIHILINCMPHIKEKVTDIKLVIVGDGAGYVETLKELARELDVAEDVIFVGFIPNEQLVYYYNMCDVFVMPTLNQEALSLTLIEAMSCGNIVIASDVSGSRSVIKEKYNGLLFKPNKTNQLAIKLIEILKDRESIAKIGENAREDISKKFNETNMISATLEILKASKKI